MVQYEEIEHTADCALHIWGDNLGELLVNAALGLHELIWPADGELLDEVEQHFDIEASDEESLLVEWLGELAYRAELERLVFHAFNLLDASSSHLKAVGRGGHATALRRYVKAVTYHNLQVVRTDRGLEATVVFDI